VDVRVIACTNRDLKEMVKKGEFREDLYYRLNVMEITLPPLRDRMEDLPLLVDHFVARFEKKFNLRIPGVSPEVMNAFMNYPWPGNIRELEHSIERAVVLSRDKALRLEHIPPEISGHTSRPGTPRPTRPAAGDNLRDTVAALEKAGWNKAKAARILGIDRKTIYRRMVRLNIEPTRDPDSSSR
jgi:DNA-binding NtrC family response regulator